MMDQGSVSPVRWLLGQSKAVQRWLLLAAIAGIAGGWLAIAQAWLLAALLAAVVLNPGASIHERSLAGLAGILLLRAVVAWGRHRAGFEAALRIRSAVRRQCLDGVVRLPRGERPPAGTLTTRLMEQVEALEGFYAQYLPQLALVAVLPVSVALVVFPLSWLAALALLLTAPVIPLFMVLVGRSAAAASQRQYDQLNRMGGQFLDLIKGLGTLKLLGASAPQASAVATAADGYRRSTLSVLRVAFLSSAVLELFASVAIALVAVYLGLSLLGRLDVGHWGAVPGLQAALFILLLAPEFYLPLRQLGAHYHARAQAIGAVPGLERLQNAGSVPAAARTGRIAHHGPTGLEFCGVTLVHRDGRRALDGLDLTAAPGERLAVVGASGAGKSSLIDLVLGLCQPTSGCVRVNGMPLSSLDVDQWRGRIAWVGQRPEWFSGSLRDNILLARPDATDGAVQDAARDAGVTEFARHLPEGLDTPLGEDGAGLSGGQLQRLALARALLRDAPLWLLDEPAAHLDAETGQVLLATLARLTAGRTVIFVTHRRPDSRLCDRVVTLQSGRVVGSANPATVRPARQIGPAPDSGSVPAAVAPLPSTGPRPLSGAAGAGRVVPFLSLAWGRRGTLALSLLLGVVTVMAGVGLLALSGWFISAAAVAGLSAASAAVFDIFRPGALVRLCAVLRTAGRYGERLVSHDATLRLLADLRVWVYRRLEPLAPGRLGGQRSGDLLQRLVGDVDALDGLFLKSAAPAVHAWVLAALVVGAVAIAFGAPSAVVVAVPLALGGVGLPVFLALRADLLGQALSGAQAEMRRALVEVLRGLATLQVYGGWRDARTKLHATGRRWEQLQLRYNRLEAWSHAWMVLLGGGAALALLVMAAPVAAQGEIAGAWVVGAVLAVLGLSEVLAPLPAGFLYAGQQRAAARRLSELASTPPTVRFPARGAGIPARTGLAFEGVWFGHAPGRPVLGGADLSIAPGSHLAVTGPSGCGKSTFAGLIARIWDPDDGRILLGDCDLRDHDEPTLRALVTLVPQHPHVFNATLGDNLRVAAPGVDDGSLWRALEVVQLADWVRAQPGALDTWAGEFGTALSGGQARRLAVARALLRRTPLVVLDEPGEGLDVFTEGRMMTALRCTMTGRTLLVVTHRQAVADCMDGVIRLQGGQFRVIRPHPSGRWSRGG